MVEYFADHRQIQVNELATSLSQLATEKNVVYQSLDQIEIQNKSRRKLLKKLLSFMTIGLDLSKLFPHVVMISSTNDPVQKKIIYQYIMEYAYSNEDLAILAINAMQKDSKDPDPSIRSLAIKSLSTLKSIDYSLPVVKEALSDTSFIVQNAAIISSIRLLLQEFDLSIPVLSKYLRNSIHSQNPSVVFNSLFAISHIENHNGFPVELSRTSTLHLIKTEWNQIVLLNIFSTFKPQDEEELISILNQLDYLLSSNLMSLVLGCSKCFLMWTKDYHNLSSHIIKRISMPLITLASTSPLESAYIIYHHLLQIISNISSEDKAIFSESFILFYLKYNDTSQIKSFKLQILSEIISDGNYEFILEHLQFYLNNQSISEFIFPILIKIAIKYPDTIDKILDSLKVCLEFENKEMVNNSIEAIRKLVISYPKYSNDILSYIEDIRDSLVTYKSKSVYASLIGEFGHEIETSPYIINEYVELCVIDNKYEPDFTIFVEELLVASLKIFIKRSPEIVDSLAKLIGFIVGDNICPHLIDRAALYYKLLQCEDLSTLSDLMFGTTLYCESQSKYKSDNWIDNFNNNVFQIDSNDSSEPLNVPNSDSFMVVSHVDSEYDIFNPSKIPRLIKPRLINPNDFENKWFDLDGPGGKSYKFNKTIKEFGCGSTTLEKSHIDEVLDEINVRIVASGIEKSEIKYFLFCCDELGNDYYIQLLVDDQIDILCKTISSTSIECVEGVFKLIYEKIIEC